MATNFPTSLDALTNPTSGQTLNSPSHSTQHANSNDAIEALQTKVGVDSSAITTSIDYKINNFDATKITTGTIANARLPVSPTFVNLTSTGNFLVWGTATTLGTGIAYFGNTVGGGAVNPVGFRWDAPNIVGTVDNSVAAVVGTVSDRRFKTNIQTLENGLATIKQLRPITYNPVNVIGFDEDNKIIVGDTPSSKVIEGFVADEVEQVAPWLVQGGENGGYQSVNYALITPMLVQAIQALDQRLSELESA